MMCARDNSGIGDVSDFHLIVIGASLEGLACATEIAKCGGKICVISNGDLFVDLQQSLFLEFLSSSINNHYKSVISTAYGWNTNPPTKFCWREIIKPIRKAVKKSLRSHLQDYYLIPEVTCIQGKVRFLSQHFLEVHDGKRSSKYWGENIIISPGIAFTDAMIPDIKGALECGRIPLDLMNITDLTAETNLMIYGNDQYAISLASLLSYLFKVTLMCPKKISAYFDEDMIEYYMEKNNLDIQDDCILHFMVPFRDNTYEVYYTQLNSNWRRFKRFHRIIFIPDTDVNLKNYEGIDELKLARTYNRIIVDDNFRTNISNIYALGRASSLRDRQHTPYQNGRNLAKFIIHGHKRYVNRICDRLNTFYGIPNYCSLGLSEKEAQESYGEENIDVYLGLSIPAECLTWIPRCNPGLIKVICLRNKENRKILGMHIVSLHTPILMQGYAAALRCGLTMDDIMNHPGIFPTVAREFTQLSVTKRSGLPIALSRCCN